MVTRLGILRKTSDDLLEHVAHGDVVDVRGVEVEFRELAHNARKLGALVHLLDLFVELKVGKDLLDVGRERVDVGGKVGGQMLRIAEQLGKRPLAGVVERIARLAA